MSYVICCAFNVFTFSKDYCRNIFLLYKSYLASASDLRLNIRAEVEEKDPETNMDTNVRRREYRKFHGCRWQAVAAALMLVDVVVAVAVVTVALGVDGWQH